MLTISLSIQQVIFGLGSWRGVQRTFEVFAKFMTFSQPSFSSIRRWVLRLGLYALQQPKTLEPDWIFIVDLTIELGTVKCLVILGIRQKEWEKIAKEEVRALKHADVEVLEVAAMAQCRGEDLQQKIEKLSQAVGVPVQILADHGSDIKKGIRLFQEQHPEVIYTYDVTHQMAILLKGELNSDQRYQEFSGRCSLARQQIKQTVLGFLMPPSQRTKSRYLNVETIVDWAQRILKYQEQNDFSAISTIFTLDAKALEKLKSDLEPTIHAQLTHLQGKSYSNLEDFTKSVCQQIGTTVFERHGEVLCQSANLGRVRFLQKLGWLKDYQAEIESYGQMIELVHCVEQQLKTRGLTSTSLKLFKEQTQSMQISPRVQRFKERIVEYIVRESYSMTDGQTRLASSDIIESIFGKYKWFSKRGASNEIGPLLLTIPLYVVEITSEFVKKAMEAVRVKDVTDWVKNVLGESMLSKRKAMFKLSSQDTETA